MRGKSGDDLKREHDRDGMLTQAEVAERLGMTISNVSMTENRALRKLKALLRPVAIEFGFLRDDEPGGMSDG